MGKWFTRELAIGIGIGFILSSFIVFLIQGKEPFISNNNTSETVKVEVSEKKDEVKKEENKKEIEDSVKVEKNEDKKDKQDVSHEEVEIVIPDYIEDSEDVIRILADNGIIDSTSSFRNRLEERGADSLLSSGVYKMPKHTEDSDKIIDILLDGPIRLYE